MIEFQLLNEGKDNFSSFIERALIKSIVLSGNVYNIDVFFFSDTIFDMLIYFQRCLL